jgi:hypothetical protein
MKMNPIRDPEYKPQWVCTECGSSDVKTMDDAWFDPNDDFCFVEAVEAGNSMDWCNDCDTETSLDEATPPDDPWGNAYGTPMYWVPPVDDEYWEARCCNEPWSTKDEKMYWKNRLGDSNGK